MRVSVYLDMSEAKTVSSAVAVSVDVVGANAVSASGNATVTQYLAVQSPPPVDLLPASWASTGATGTSVNTSTSTLATAAESGTSVVTAPQVAVGAARAPKPAKLSRLQKELLDYNHKGNKE